MDIVKAPGRGRDKGLRIAALLVLLALGACAADPLARVCAPLDEPTAYANCRLGPLGPHGGRR